MQHSNFTAPSTHRELKNKYVRLIRQKHWMMVISPENMSMFVMLTGSTREDQKSKNFTPTPQICQQSFREKWVTNLLCKSCIRWFCVEANFSLRWDEGHEEFSTSKQRQKKFESRCCSQTIKVTTFPFTVSQSAYVKFHSNMKHADSPDFSVQKTSSSSSSSSLHTAEPKGKLSAGEASWGIIMS